MLRKRIWRGITGIVAVLLTLFIFSTSLAWDRSAEINNVLGTSTSVLVSDGDESSEGAETVYYKSDYDSIDSAKQAARVHNVQTSEDGSVLLKNDGALPFDSSVKKVTLLGRASFDTIYRNSSAGQTTGDDLVTLKGAFEAAGIKINDTVYNAYAESSTKRVLSQKQVETDIGEESIGFYTDSILNSFTDYSDAAVIVLSRSGSEGNDLSTSDIDGMSQLALHQDEKDLLKLAHEHFSKVIVLVNSGNPLELGWLDEDNVNACLWIGTPGNYGLEGVINLLTGKATPSGRLADTYAANSFSSAAFQNYGSIAWTNGKDLDLGLISRTALDTTGKYVVEVEGIYVGYKYYETRYEDCILNQGNANGNYGIYASQGSNWNYADEMAYPFGYGLSYTAFSQKLDSVTFDATTHKYTATVTVTNTGDTYSGKNAVQLYVQSPYTQYDKDNLVEKSSIQLIGFNKTGLLAPGESQTLTIDVDEYLLASYDYKGFQSYILDAGDWYFSIGNDCHDALNNVLAAKGATGMYDQFGKETAGDTSKTYHWTYDKMDSTTYKTAPSGTNVENHMQEADINYWLDNSVVYLTRNDWSTFPKKLELAATQELADVLTADNQPDVEINEQYTKPADAPSVSDITLGAQNGLSFIDMKEVDWNDTELWNKLLDQLTVDDLISIVNGAGLESINMPQPKQGDGPDGAAGVQFVGQFVAVSSFDPELLRVRGDLIAELDMLDGVNARWAPGGNLHRTPFGGRNFEYFSEDSILSYLAEEIMCSAMQNKGEVAAPKHFAGNEQETNRRGGCVFTTEQAWREVYLKGFEGAFTKGNALGTMTSYMRYGPTFTAESSAVQIDILRGEWGFKGYTITDFGSASTADMVTNGTVQSGGMERTSQLSAYLKDNDDGNIVNKLKENAKYWVYAFAHSNLTNGLSSNMKVVNVTPWWKTALISVDIVFGVLTLAAIAIYILLGNRKKRREA